MKNGEFTKGDLLVDPDMEVDLENGTVTACLETWFDVDEKFGLHTAGRTVRSGESTTLLIARNYWSSL